MPRASPKNMQSFLTRFEEQVQAGTRTCSCHVHKPCQNLVQTMRNEISTSTIDCENATLCEEDSFYFHCMSDDSIQNHNHAFLKSHCGTWLQERDDGAFTLSHHPVDPTLKLTTSFLRKNSWFATISPFGEIVVSLHEGKKNTFPIHPHLCRDIPLIVSTTTTTTTTTTSSMDENTFWEVWEDYNDDTTQKTTTTTQTTTTQTTTSQTTTSQTTSSQTTTSQTTSTQTTSSQTTSSQTTSSQTTTPPKQNLIQQTTHDAMRATTMGTEDRVRVLSDSNNAGVWVGTAFGVFAGCVGLH